MFETVWSDLRVGLRVLLRSRAFSLTAILTLAIGMSATTLVFTVINAVLLRPLPVSDPDRMVAVSTAGEMAFLQQEPLAFGDALDLAREVPAFESVVAHRRTPTVIGAGVESRVALGESVSANYFTTLAMPLAIGRPFAADDDPDAVVVLSHSVWRQRFGRDPSVIGRDITLAGRSRTIVGVAPEGFTGLFRGIAPEFWTPVESRIARPDDRTTLQWWVHARLQRAASLDQATAQVAGVARALAERYPESNAGRTFRLERLVEASAHPAVPKAFVSAGALGSLALALLLLTVASVNVANLVLARAVIRQREIAIRTAVGATRWRIVRQLLSEGVVLAACAAVVALVISTWAGQALSAVPLPIAAIAIDLHLAPDWRVFTFTAMVALLTAVLFAAGPAIRTSRQPISIALSNESRTSTSGMGTRVRTWLLAAQAAVAMLLLILGGLALRSLAETTRVNPGFDTDSVIVATASPGLIDYDRERALNFMTETATRVRALPGVQSAGWMHPVPLSLNIRITRLRLPGQEGVAIRELPFIDASVAWPGAFATIQIPVLAGREFTDRDRAGENAVAIVNDTFVRRYFPDGQAIGRRIAVGFPETTNVEIIGVVRDFKNRTLGDIARPMAVTSGLQDPFFWQTATLMVRPLPAQPIAPGTVIDALRTIDSAVPVYDVQPLTTRMGGVLLLPRYAAALLGGIGFISLALIVVGLFGSVSFWVHSRTRELGVRLALGSARTAIIWLVTKQTFLPVAIGGVIGVVGALLAARAMTVLLYGVSPQDPIALIVAVAVLTLATLGASALPAWRAARLDPMQALRTD